MRHAEVCFKLPLSLRVVLTSSKFQKQSIKTNDNYGHRPCKTCISYRNLLIWLGSFVAKKTRPILQNKILILRIWVPPYLRRPIGTGSDHFSCIGRMMFGPRNKFFMSLRRRVWLQDFCLGGFWDTAKLQNKRNGHTSRRSQAHTCPFSSPQTTLASAWPKHARQRYASLTCPVKSFNSFPVELSMSLIWLSRVSTKRVWASCVGTTDVTGSVRRSYYEI